MDLNIILRFKNSKNRKIRIIWFNPAFRFNISTNIGKKFFNLLDKHFPKTDQLLKLFNRNNVEVSYISLPNFKSMINSKNTLNNRQNKRQNIMLIKRELPVPRHKAKPFALHWYYITNI